MGCWEKKLAAGSGKQLCGQKHNGWNEEKIKIKCAAPAVNGQFTVRVSTKLNSAANDESFGIDNVVLKQLSSGSGGFKTITANFQNDKDFQGFNCVKITNCGSLGKICGGYNTKAKSHDIKKTYKDLPDGTYTISLDFIKIDSWDNENAYVQVNGKTCWQKKLAGSGKQVCGSKNGGWNEDRIKVSCTGPAVKGQFTVRVYTQLNSAANDESFGIDNVVLKKLPPFKTITANFQNDKDFQGFNCVKIQNCGSYGKICGGYNTKAKGHDIKKTYKNLPAGKYTVSLDFIKIDSWDNENAYVQVNGKTCWTKKLAGQGKQVCGSKNGGWNEDRIKVLCTASAVNNQFTVRVYTQLNSAANDES